MEKIYSTKKNVFDIPRVGPETIQLLVAYSKALRIINHRQFSFEVILN
ncbi:hypothetical protein [Muriicola sp.]